MKRLSTVILMCIVFLMLNGCAAMYVNSTVGQGVQPHVKKEMVKNEKRIRKEQRQKNKVHSERRRIINTAKQQPWI